MNMCNMRLLAFEMNRNLGHDNMVLHDDAGMDDPNVNAIGQALAQIGDNLNDETLHKCKYLRLAAIGVVAFATVVTLYRNFA